MMMQQQATAVHLRPLIESGRCKRDFSHVKKENCFKGCDNPSPHPESECEYYLGLSVSKRRDLCHKWRRCYKCLAKGYDYGECQSALEEEVHPLLSIRKSGKPDPISAGYVSVALTSTGSPVMVSAQVILDPSGDQYTVMFNTGSQITLITKDCATKLGAKEIGDSIVVILGIRNGRALPYKIYEVTLISTSGEPVTFRAHSVSELKIEVAEYDAASLNRVS